MTRYYTRSQPVEARLFTKAMAEGQGPLPPLVRCLDRTLDGSGHFPETMRDHWPRYEGFHRHRLTTPQGEVPVHIGDWLVTDPTTGSCVLLSPEQFTARYTDTPPLSLATFLPLLRTCLHQECQQVKHRNHQMDRGDLDAAIEAAVQQARTEALPVSSLAPSSPKESP